jgi:hypothetical protein
MYKLNALVLVSRVSSDTFQSVYGKVRSRVISTGLALKDCKGEDLKVNTPSAKKDRHLILSYSHSLPNVEVFEDFSRVENETLASRIIDYYNHYYGKVITNCSSFVEYLRTGRFPQYDEGFFSFTGSMNQYSGQKIRPGDSVCILYYRDRYARSRKISPEVRNHYRVNKKKKDPANSFDTKKKNFSINDLIYVYNHGLVRDYHFMHCIGERNGQPLFISQVGRYDPKLEREKNPILVTLGMSIGCCTYVPICTYIKRGR